jgi:FkbM family methyltransferase
MRLMASLPFLARLRNRRPETFQHGHRLADDFRRRQIAPSLIFDVGANVGQTALGFADAFPEAIIHAFEPFQETFSALEHNTRAKPTIRAHRLALGAAPGAVSAELKGSVINSIIKSEAEDAGPGRQETVTVETIDRFCGREGISSIGFLKIDTEGYDLEVLKGAGNMLAAQRIDLLQVEAGMNACNRKHVPFADFLQFLEPHQYLLFGIYDQTPEWSGEARLRFSNPVFISTRMMEQLGRRRIRSSSHDEGFQFR